MRDSKSHCSKIRRGRLCTNRSGWPMVTTATERMFQSLKQSTILYNILQTFINIHRLKILLVYHKDSFDHLSKISRLVRTSLRALYVQYAHLDLFVTDELEPSVLYQ